MYTEFVRVKVSDLEEMLEKIERLKEIIEIRDNEIVHLKEERATLTKDIFDLEGKTQRFERILSRKNATIESLRNAPRVEVPFFDLKLYA